MSFPGRLEAYIATIVAAAAVALAAAFVFHPPTFSSPWLIAFATLLGLAIISVLFALRVTEGGSTTAMDFVPLLGSIVLLGPSGAGAVVVLQQVVSEFLILRKPAAKAIFNTAQVTLAVLAGAFLYSAFGGDTGLANINFRTSFPPFVLAVLAYFGCNTTLAPYAISLAEHRSFTDIWRQFTGRIIILDLVMSPLAYLLAFLYVQWGAIALLSAVIPIIGLRYSYGVNIELQRLNQDLLRVLIKTLEARDQYTSGHSLRVAEMSKRIGHGLRVRPKDLRIIETGALLHDIGKIDLAYGEILRQTGPLSPAQRELIRAHPDKGVAIMESVRSLDPRVLDCIRHHHEWYDGTGYPVGLAGEEIPIGARIIMIADAVDAMMTDRPYRAALSLEAVKKELERNSGTQFDPDLIRLVLDSDILDEVTLPQPSSGSDVVVHTGRPHQPQPPSYEPIEPR